MSLGTRSRRGRLWEIVGDWDDFIRYEISEEDYLKREDNFRAWKEAKKRQDPSWSFAKEIKERQDAQRKKADPSFVPEPWKEVEI